MWRGDCFVLLDYLYVGDVQQSIVLPSSDLIFVMWEMNDGICYVMFQVLLLRDWFHSLAPADIFCAGVYYYQYPSQECLYFCSRTFLIIRAFILCLHFKFYNIVPLNAGAVLGAEDNGPAKKMTLPHKEKFQVSTASAFLGQVVPSLMRN